MLCGARLVAAIADGEDPGAAASDPADPVGDSGSVARVHDRLQLDAARAKAVGAARRPAQRPRSETVVPRNQVGKPEGVPAGWRQPPGRRGGSEERVRCRGRPHRSARTCGRVSAAPSSS